MVDDLDPFSDEVREVAPAVTKVEDWVGEAFAVVLLDGDASLVDGEEEGGHSPGTIVPVSLNTLVC